MTREQQRELGTLARSVANMVRADRSTYVATVHAPADLMEHLSLEGGELLRDYSAKERRRMAQIGHAMGDGSYAIGTCEEAETAMQALGRAPNRQAVENHIRKRVTALRCSGKSFDQWKSS